MRIKGDVGSGETLKFSFGTREYRARGFFGVLGTLIALPAIGIATVGGVVLALACAILAIPGMLIALIGAERIK